MKREDLKKALALAKPSLGGSESVVPILSNFCFDEETVFAFNFITAIFVPLPTKLSCALHGDTLMGLLDAGESESIDLVQRKDIVELIDASGVAKMPFLPISDADVKIPEAKSPFYSGSLGPKMLEGLQACALTMGEDSLKPEFAGITFAAEKGSIAFFSSNNASATRVEMKTLARTSKGAAVLPHQTCALLFKLAQALGLKDTKISVGESGFSAEFEGGTTLISKMLPAKPEMFVGMFERIEPKSFKPIPPTLRQEIAKACVLSQGFAETRLAASARKMATISSSGTFGSASGEIESPPGLERAIVFDSKRLAPSLPLSSEWAIGGNFTLVLRNEKAQYTFGLSAREGRD